MNSLAALVAAAVGLLVPPVAPSVSSNTSREAFCASPGPRDYATPLAKLPPINEFPPKSKEHPGLGNLPLGPRTVEMYLSTRGPVIVRPHRFGAAFWDVGFLGNKPEREPKVDWLVTAQLIALDSTGAELNEVAHGHILIGRINNTYQPGLDLPVPDRLGSYRFDIQIANAGGNGKVLGRYSEYLRVVAPSVRVRLGINSRRFRPGQTFATRPEQLGTDSITYGAGSGVQRRVRGKWTRYPPMNGGLFPLWLGILGPGGAGACGFHRIPADAAAGRYRIVQSVGVASGHKPGRALH